MRLVDGEKQFFEDDSLNSIIRDALAKRTFDESGNYYVKPFNVKVKESLNNRKGNKGIYLPGQTTQDGGTPSDDLMIYQISPGKAYVRGYDIQTISNTNLDVPKARTTKLNDKIGINQILDSNGSKSASYGKQFDIKKPGKIIANKLIRTIDSVDRNTKYDKKLLDFCSKIELK